MRAAQPAARLASGASTSLNRPAKPYRLAKHQGSERMWNATEVEDQRIIRQLVENWAVWRDALMWDRFRTVWHDDARMMATWFQGSADEFIKVSQAGYERGVRILHFLGGSSIELAGARPTRAGRDRAVRCGLRRPGLRFPGKPGRAVGPGAAPADLREGPPRPGGP